MSPSLNGRKVVRGIISSRAVTPRERSSYESSWEWRSKMSWTKDLALGFLQMKITESKAKEVFDRELEKKAREADKKDMVAEVRRRNVRV